MIKPKKAELTLETIVIAVLVLVVLAVLLFIAYKYILGSSNQFGALSDCKAKQDSIGCVAKKEDCAGTAFWKIGGCGEKDQKNNEYCCIVNK